MGKDEKGLLIAKLADFGLSLFLDKDTDEPESFDASVPAGTKCYMADEAKRGRVSPTVDVYAFGMVVVMEQINVSLSLSSFL